MIQPDQILLLDEVDASVVTVSSEFSQCLNYHWSIQVKKTATNGNPLLLIEQSNDAATWFPYIDKEITTDCIINSEILINDDDVLITDEFFPARNIRVTLSPNGTTAGTVSALLSEKIRS